MGAFQASTMNTCKWEGGGFPSQGNGENLPRSDRRRELNTIPQNDIQGKDNSLHCIELEAQEKLSHLSQSKY